MFINYYEILGIEIGATEEQIKKAYRLNAIKYHPDKNFGDPYFAKTFIAIKDAYDNLIDPQKRAEFDIIYRQRFAKTTSSTNDTYQEQQAKQENQRQEQYERQQRTERKKQEEEKFRYDPYKQFYSDYDRELQDTPQFEPKQTPWGEDISGILIFFELPKKIGKIVGGYSTLVKGLKKTSFFRLLYSAIISSYIAIPVIAVIMLLLWNNWHNNLHKENSTETALIAFGVLTAIVIIFKIYANYNLVSFNHLNYYIGVNGFALFKCEGSTENVTSRQEVNFNDVTDLYTSQTINKRNFSYVDTTYQFVWMNTATSKIKFASAGSYNDEKGNPNKYAYSDYWMNKYAENYWTLYLLDKMESMLQKNGHILFRLYSIDKNLYQDYIKLGIGYITFIKPGGQEFTYKFNDIKKIYAKGGELRIQHKNFEKTLFFFKSGNDDVIPLTNLCNRQFFIKGIEILLGYTLS